MSTNSDDRPHDYIKIDTVILDGMGSLILQRGPQISVDLGTVTLNLRRFGAGDPQFSGDLGTGSLILWVRNSTCHRGRSKPGYLLECTIPLQYIGQRMLEGEHYIYELYQYQSSGSGYILIYIQTSSISVHCRA